MNEILRKNIKFGELRDEGLKLLLESTSCHIKFRVMLTSVPEALVKEAKEKNFILKTIFLLL
jgi:hypothetical protein